MSYRHFIAVTENEFSTLCNLTEENPCNKKIDSENVFDKIPKVFEAILEAFNKNGARFSIPTVFELLYIADIWVADTG